MKTDPHELLRELLAVRREACRAVQDLNGSGLPKPERRRRQQELSRLAEEARSAHALLATRLPRIERHERHGGGLLAHPAWVEACQEIAADLERFRARIQAAAEVPEPARVPTVARWRPVRGSASESAPDAACGPSGRHHPQNHTNGRK